MTMTSLKGRHALVTGGGRGIGRAIAGCLVKAGATVTIVGRSPATLEQAIVQGDAHAAAVADITDREAVQAAVQDAVARYGPVDLLIANAGAAASAPFMKTGPDMFRQMLDVNLLGVTNTAHAVLGSMTEKRLRAHRRRGVDRRPQGLSLCERLLRRQACRDRLRPRLALWKPQGTASR